MVLTKRCGALYVVMHIPLQGCHDAQRLATPQLCHTALLSHIPLRAHNNINTMLLHDGSLTACPQVLRMAEDDGEVLLKLRKKAHYKNLVDVKASKGHHTTSEEVAGATIDVRGF